MDAKKSVHASFTSLDNYSKLFYGNISTCVKRVRYSNHNNRPFSYPKKESGSSDILNIFMHKVRLNDVRTAISIVQNRKLD